MFAKTYDTKIGKITICEENGCITNIYFGNENIGEDLIEKETQLIKEAIRQIKLYLDGKLRNITVPLKIEGTEFQKSVWNELTKIPYGETASYLDIAKRIGNEKACRAVGNANNKNKLPIIIPCHRVIGKDGKLVGFAGGLNIKERLLEIERKCSGKCL